jgi:uncharacterized protein (UPF0332 family)
MASADAELYLNRAHQDLQAVQNILDQGFYNIAISRAYYAMFYAATALLTSKGVARSKHSGVISAFSEYFVKTGLIETEYARMLAHAFNSRLGSDYDVTSSVDKISAEAVIQDARRFVDRAEAYLQQAGIL